MTRPIRPNEVVDAKARDIPDGVIETFNGLIVRYMKGNEAHVPQNEVVEDIGFIMACDRNEIFDKGWLNVEELYRNEGWIVEYCKPSYDESWPAYFVFRRPNKQE